MPNEPSPSPPYSPLPPPLQQIRGSELNLRLDVSNCPQCGGRHDVLLFTPLLPEERPEPGKTHQATCPVTGEAFHMDTQRIPGVWDNLLRDAGYQGLNSSHE